VKLVIDRNAFANLFQLAAAVAPTRSPKPILQNIKIEATKDDTILTATDTEVGVRLHVPNVEVKTPGAAVIPVSRLSMILRESTDDTLELTTDGEKTIVEGKHSRFELQGQNPDEFPDVSDFDEKNYYEIIGSVFHELIKRTLFATDAESSRYALGGILLEFSESKVIAVGTDGRRLAKMEGPIKTVGKPGGSGTTIVPSKSMQLMDRILPHNSEASVKIATRQNDLLVQHDTSVFSTRLVEGRFPKWRDVIPTRQESTRIDLPVGPIHSALKQAAIVSSEESRGIDFTFKDGSLVLTNSTAEVGQSRVEMPVPYEAGEMTITLDHRFVSDFLKVLEPEKNFTFDIENGESAAYCLTEDNYGYVIMPLSRERN
jgi:DNA polymerase-3 subunit beta